MGRDGCASTKKTNSYSGGLELFVLLLLIVWCRVLSQDLQYVCDPEMPPPSIVPEK